MENFFFLDLFNCESNTIYKEKKRRWIIIYKKWIQLPLGESSLKKEKKIELIVWFRRKNLGKKNPMHLKCIFTMINMKMRDIAEEPFYH